MEVINENAGLLSNLEVLLLLKDVQAGRNNQQKPNKDQQNLGTITYETVKYLERSPCALQTPDHVAAFMHAMKDFALTRAEKLQLLNNRPTSEVELILMVEESEERFSDEDIGGLVTAIATHLPGPEAEVSVAAVAEEEEEMEEKEEGEEAVDEDYVAI
ncbi:DNA-directed RNA polymerase III subunit RPC9-like [Littorina saxatilis]|uniref:DNA-directed RNA polymerase III subunit RPC9 n=1 Tax=Littorina saxatilis TaxID=31220 RepID=A0AAN9GAX5_9CAEN